MRRRHVFLSIAFVLLAGPLRAADEPADYADVPLKDLGVVPVTPKKDAKTGFVVGGKNETALLRGLPSLNGRTVAELETDMRPGALSTAGFLGKDEKLLDILAADNRTVVEEWGLTHQELAVHLRALGAIVVRRQKDAKLDDQPFVYHGRHFKGTAALARGFQESPFEDGTRTNVLVTLQNTDAGKTLKYSLLVPDMIERYGFYEGKGTPYRVDPAKILAVLDFLPKKGAGRK